MELILKLSNVYDRERDVGVEDRIPRPSGTSDDSDENPFGANSGCIEDGRVE